MDGDPFLAAIIAAPDDDTPRLVYADWLDENGDSPRAEFIRVQVEQARRPAAAFARRGDELLTKWKDAWQIPGISGVQTFRRGFVEGLYMPAPEFLAHAERIGRAAPVTELRLPLAIQHLEALAAVPWMARVEHLDLTGNVGVGSRLDDFFGVLDLPRLKHLELRNCQLWPEHVAALARLASRWPQLARLNLSGNPIGDEGAERLAQAGEFHRLTELSLRCDEQPFVDAIHAFGAASLAHTPNFARLRHLDLNGHYLGDAGFISIVESRTLQRLETLDLGYNEIGTISQDCYEHLMQPNRLPRLRKLVLDGNHIERMTLRNLVQWPRLAEIESLSLRNCVWGSDRGWEDPDVPGIDEVFPWHDKFLFDDDRGGLA